MAETAAYRKSWIFLQYTKAGCHNDPGETSSHCNPGCKLYSAFSGGIDSSWNFCGIQAELKKRLFLRRTFHADDGNAQLLCWPGIYLPVCYCIPDSAIWRNVQFQRSTYLWRSDEAYDPAMPGAFLPADRRLGKTYAKQYA